MREGIQGPLANCSLFSQTVFLARWTVGARRSASPPPRAVGLVAARNRLQPATHSDPIVYPAQDATRSCDECVSAEAREGALGARWGRTGAASEAHWGRVGGAPDQTCGLIAVHGEGPYHLPAVLLGRPSSQLLLSRRFPWRERQGWRGAVHAAGGGPRGGGATSSAGRDGPRTTQSPGDATPPGPGSFVLLGSTTAAERATASSSCGDARSTWPAGRSPPQEPPQPQ